MTMNPIETGSNPGICEGVDFAVYVLSTNIGIEKYRIEDLLAATVGKTTDNGRKLDNMNGILSKEGEE